MIEHAPAPFAFRDFVRAKAALHAAVSITRAEYAFLGSTSQQIQNSGTDGRFCIQVDLTLLPAPLNTPVLPGDTWNFTAWYRDKNPTTTSNFSDGVSVLFD